MATTNGSTQEAFTPILQAVNSMRDGHREEKKVAHEYLEKFQKSVGLISIFRCLAFHFIIDSFSGGSLGGHHRDPAIQRKC